MKIFRNTGMGNLKFLYFLHSYTEIELQKIVYFFSRKYTHYNEEVISFEGRVL